MLLLIHIIIALSSLLYVTVLCIKPAERAFFAAYALIVSTLASGTALVFSLQAPLLRSCMSGLLYLAAASFGVFIARQRLMAAQKQHTRD